MVNMVVGADISACVRRERGGVCGDARAERRLAGAGAWNGASRGGVVWCGR